MTVAETREQATGGTCTWALLLSTGQYVYDPNDGKRTGFDLNYAHVWLSEDSARAFALRTNWAGASARPTRARP
jgi:hypothetical protein